MHTMTSSATAMLLVGLALGLAVGAMVGLVLAGVRAGRDRAADGAESAERAELLHGLDRLSDQMRELEQQRSTWQGRLHQQVHDMRLTTEELRRETGSLATALRRPAVRGRWGEMHLRRAVELAGLVDRCDFVEQPRLDDGARVPDVVVRLAGERSLAIDAKVPLDAYLDAAECDDADRRSDLLRQHAERVRAHVDALGARRYWQALPESPEFVVLFLPAESFLSAALEVDRHLLEHATRRGVVLATPTTLIALLRTVAHGWRHDTLAAQARQIHGLGRDLHERLGRMIRHLDAVGRSLNAAVGHYNDAAGSLESRVLVGARRFVELGVTDEVLDAPRQVDASARSLGVEEPVHLDAARRAHQQR